MFGNGAEVWKQTTVLERIFEHNRSQNQAQSRGDGDGAWLLPMAYPEGSPTHPAYPGGHSAFIAAAATIAKAFFADGEFPCPKVPVDGGQTLVDVDGPTLTVHGELNKLIANVTLFRDAAGMHWCTDGTAAARSASTGCSATALETGGNALGEKLAITMLRDTRRTYREQLGSFRFQDLSGRSVELCSDD